MSYEINHRRKTQKILKRRERGGGGGLWLSGFYRKKKRKEEESNKSHPHRHKIDFYIPNQWFKSILLRSDSKNSHKERKKKTQKKRFGLIEKALKSMPKAHFFE